MTSPARRVPIGGMAAIILLSGIGVLTVAPPKACHADLMLQDGDRMVFLGDSITAQRIYTRYVINHFTLAYPDLNLTFHEAGVSGDTTVGAIKRVDQDVVALNPDVVSICLGMNDGGYIEFNGELYETYLGGMAVLLSYLQSADDKAPSKVVLLTPGAVDPEHRRWESQNLAVYNDVLARYAEGLKAMAARRGVPIYDIHALMMDVIQRGRAQDPQFTIIPDGVHPNAAGHALMAYGLIKALGSRFPVSRLEIHAQTGAVIADKCTVTNLRVSNRQVRFTRRDAALPTYLDPEALAVLPYAPVLGELHQYWLKVTGLPSGEWRLTVNGGEVGAFSSDALARGVNLAGHPGPWQTLGKAVNDLVADRSRTRGRRREQGGAPTPAAPSPSEAGTRAPTSGPDQLSSPLDQARALVNDRTWEWRLERLP
jgi:lysophospholipase L1-like esterase